MTQPLIVVGMHRSGTSLLMRALAEQGLFIGRDASKHAESLFFHAFNQRILAETGAAWDQPAPALAAMRDPQIVERFARSIGKGLRGLRTWRYLGGRWLAARAAIGPHLRFAWGFKDPRSSLLLPVWLRVFPGAKVLRIRRHGIDVAASLVARELRRQRPGHCRTLANGLALWADHEDALDRALTHVSPGRQLIVRFEDYAADFPAVQTTIDAFAGLAPSRRALAAMPPEPSRSLAYRASAELRAEAGVRAAALRARGYEP